MKSSSLMRLLIASLLQIAIYTPVHSANPLVLPDVPTTRSDPVNLVFAIDGSGSMDMELTMDNGTRDGSLYWKSDTSKENAGYFTKSSNGVSYFDQDTIADNKALYLFPNGISSILGDQKSYSYTKNANGYVVPPLQGFMFARSPNYNTSYYNPKKEYKKWIDGYIGGSVVSFSDSNFTAARSHPYFTKNANNNSGTPTTFDLSKTYFGQYTSPLSIDSSTGLCGTYTTVPVTYEDFGYSSTNSNGSNTLRDGTKRWSSNQWVGATVYIYSGTGAGQTLSVIANTTTVLTVSGSWNPRPRRDSVYILRLNTTETTGTAFDREWTIPMLPGMVIPKTVSPQGNYTTQKPCYSEDGGVTWRTIEKAPTTTIDASGVVQKNIDVMIPYNPATVWLLDNTCTNAFPECDTAPDGNKLRRYDLNSITSSITYKFADGTEKTRTKAEEQQNFANWFTYYRKRKLLAGGAYGLALERARTMGNVRASNVYISGSAITIPDFKYLNDKDPSKNYKSLAGEVYLMPGIGGTPSTITMYNIAKKYGAKFNSSDFHDNEKLTCQRFNSFLLTDGFANDFSSSIPSITLSTENSKKWFTEAPYGQPFVNSDGKGIDSNGFEKSFTNIASYFYAYDLTTDLGLSGTQPELIVDVNQSGNKKYDSNPKPHINTYAISIGAKGAIYGLDALKTTDPYKNYPTWEPPVWNTNKAIDDLWHATINGRGKFLLASDSSALEDGMAQIIGNMVAMDSRTALTVSSRVLTANDRYAFLTTFAPGVWTGDISARLVDLATGEIGGAGDAIWSAATQLDSQYATESYTKRIISTWDGSKGISFTPDSNGVGSNNSIFSTSTTTNDANDVINYLRGDRSKEYSATNSTGIYKQRESLLGDIVNSQPAYIKNKGLASYSDKGYAAFSTSADVTTRSPMLYVGSNDGMMHAIDASTYDTSGDKVVTGGNELWAYVPKLVHANLFKLAKQSENHIFTVDGPTVANDVDFGNTYNAADNTPDWRTIVVGAFRSGGKGLYALDVTKPNLKATDTSGRQNELNTKVLWEFSHANMGASFGKPVIVKTEKYGWVVLVASGYNNIGDGRAHLFMLNAKTGALIHDFDTNEGSTTSPAGLANIGVLYEFDSSVNALVNTAYGSDLNGSVWRFNLIGSDSGTFETPVKLLSLPRPITSAPVATYSSLGGVRRKMVYIGTGKILETGDLNDYSLQNYVVGIEDKSDNSTVVVSGTGTAAALVSIATSTTGGNATSTTSQTNDAWHADNIGLLSAANATKYNWWTVAGKRGFIMPTAPGDQVISDMVYYKDLLIFSATAGVNATTICADAISYLYLLDARTGTEVASTYFPSINGKKSSWSRKSVGSGFSNTPTPYKTTGNGETVAVCPSGNCTEEKLPSFVGTLKRFGWREIYK